MQDGRRPGCRAAVTSAFRERSGDRHAIVDTWSNGRFDHFGSIADELRNEFGLALSFWSGTPESHSRRRRRCELPEFPAKRITRRPLKGPPPVPMQK
jgi:hypothetical protein